MVDHIIGKITQLTHTPLEAYGNPLKLKPRKIIKKKGNTYSMDKFGKGDFGTIAREARETRMAKARRYEK